jgi:pimeloyl-ACP methyl ester carboxylesterase
VLKFFQRLLVAGAVLFVLLLVGARIADRRASDAFWGAVPSPPGRMVDTPDGPVHLYCWGDGDVLVLHVAGLGDPYRSWGTLYGRYPGDVLACAYDRAGIGFSPEAGSPKTPTRAANEMLALIQAAAPAGTPVILVGHGLGGLYARHFAHMYPRDVAGLVLLDPWHESMETRMPGPGLAARLAWRLPLALRDWGVSRQSFNAVTGDVDPDAAPLLAELYSSGRSARGIRTEWAGFRESASEVTTVAGILGERPVLVLTADQVAMPAGSDSPEAREAWADMHREIAAESGRGFQQDVPGSRHYLHIDAPQLVAGEVLRMVAEALSSRPAASGGTGN